MRRWMGLVSGLCLSAFLTMFSGSVLAADLPVKAAPQPAVVTSMPSWYVRLGVLAAFPETSATIHSTVPAVDALLVGASASSNNNYTFGFDVGYFFTQNFAVSLTAGVPPTLKLYGAGTLPATLAGVGLGNHLGSVVWGPAMATAHYHFTSFGAFQPYLGIGAAYAIIFKNEDATLANLKVKNNFGFVTQAGFDYMIGRNWGLFVDVKKVWLATDASGVGTGALAGVPLAARVKVDPWVLFSGITYRF